MSVFAMVETTHEDFAKLRSILASAPSKEGFVALLALFASWTHSDTQDLALTYAQEHLATWPDTFRIAEPKDIWPRFPHAPPPAMINLLRGLDITEPITRPLALKAITLPPFARELRILRIKHMHTKIGMELLTQARHLSQLQQLSIHKSQLTRTDAAILVSSPYLHQLRHLALPHNRLGEDGITFIAHAPILQGLQSLDLSHNAPTDKSACAIAQSSYMHALTTLRLNEPRSNWQTIGDKGAMAIASSPYLSHLRELGFAGHHISPRALEALASSSSLSGLQCLDLSYHTRYPHPFAGILTAPTSWTQLTQLKLNGLYGSDVLLERLSNGTPLKQLQRLELDANHITPEGIASFADSRKIRQLQHLSLAHNHIHDEGASYLASSPNTQHLRTLDLHQNEIGDFGAKRLAESSYLSQLKTLVLSGNALGEEGFKAIAFSETLSAEVRREYIGFVARDDLLKEADRKGLRNPRSMNKTTLLHALLSSD
ncbi:MAG TPA: hypothetical protein DCE42_21880 [Myxococcales bacterium]|nr:hypothetical protein [Deltaproteobacteria bacterium]MBU52587.1 hypothetical protein [Deltaproteobacteria bacterium]HAA57430.1 hypothetical protein [Myxococcales bacterium]